MVSVMGVGHPLSLDATRNSMENPNRKRMRTGGTSILGNPHVVFQDGVADMFSIVF
jgi:hypothetical protein